jgi:undecaprenyl-diphosphatase
MGDALCLLQALDRKLFLLLNGALHDPLLDILMPLLSDKWFGLWVAAICVPALALRYGRRAWALAGLAVLAVAVTDLGANAIKHAVERVRPCHVLEGVRLLSGCTRSFALPSNHAANLAAIAGVLWLSVGRWRWIVLLLAAGVGYSRVYLGVHYPTDVLVGALWGGVVGYGTAWGAARLLPTSWTLRPVAGRESSPPQGDRDSAP